jgi:Kef-type K+ transport system membrane component KefB
VSGRLPAIRPIGPRPRLALVALLLVLVAGALLTLDPAERFEEFKAKPPELVDASVQEHLVSGSGNGRWQIWGAALDEFRESPWNGGGAGSFEAWWLQHRSLGLPVRDAHSLYIETLAELGLVGLLPLLALAAMVVVVGARRLSGTSGLGHASVVALCAALLGYAFEAGIDWMWEMPVVTLLAMILLGLLLGPASLPPGTEPARAGTPWPLAARGAAVLAVAGLLTAQLLSLVPALQLRKSQEAAERGDLVKAAEQALAARAIAPWAASPHLQLALVREQAGDLEAAHEAITEALERDGRDWRLWLTAARIATRLQRGTEAAASLEEAERLNPRSPLFEP